MSRCLQLVDYSIASLTGASQVALAFCGWRSFLMIHNPGSANAGINPTGGVAAVGSAGTITLVPNGTMTFNIDGVPQNAITVVGTAGQPLTVLASPA